MLFPRQAAQADSSYVAASLWLNEALLLAVTHGTDSENKDQKGPRSIPGTYQKLGVAPIAFEKSEAPAAAGLRQLVGAL